MLSGLYVGMKFIDYEWLLFVKEYWTFLFGFEIQQIARSQCYSSNLLMTDKNVKLRVWKSNLYGLL